VKKVIPKVGFCNLVPLRLPINFSLSLRCTTKQNFCRSRFSGGSRVWDVGLKVESPYADRAQDCTYWKVKALLVSGMYPSMVVKRLNDHLGLELAYTIGKPQPSPLPLISHRVAANRSNHPSPSLRRPFPEARYEVVEFERTLAPTLNGGSIW